MVRALVAKNSLNISWRYAVPAKTKKQLRFMQAVAHNKAFAKKVGVPQSVGKEMSSMPMMKGKGK